MNVMTGAMMKAGMQLPTLGERVWNYVKEHPKVNSPSVAAALKQHNDTVSSLLSKMSIRGMLRVEEVAMRGRIGAGYGVRKVKHYSVSIPEYEMLPVPKNYVKRRAERSKNGQDKQKEIFVPAFQIVSKQAEPPKVTAQVAPPAPAKKTAKELVEGMTIKEAKELYLELKEAFRLGY